MYRYMITEYMTQVSRRKLHPDSEKRIYQIFIDVICDAHSYTEVQALLDDLFTPTERVMLPKRLVIAYLLLKNYPHRTIASYVNVSHTTINRVSTSPQNGGKGYTLLLTRLQKREQFSRMLDTIEEGALSILASARGPSTLWKNLHQAHIEQKRNRPSF